MTDSQRRPGRQRSASRARSVVIIGCAVFVTYCSGKTSINDGEGPTTVSNAGTAATAGYGYAGHTPSSCYGICGGQCGPCGGYGGSGGTSAGGVSGSAATAGYGYSGHTGNCICGFGCMPCSSGGFGGAGAGGVDAGGEAGEAGALPFSLPATRVTARACYSTVAYEPGACLPADDALLSWLSGVPQGCEAHVSAGPFTTSLREQQSCCYDVACRAR
jgi:hypothetical protein